MKTILRTNRPQNKYIAFSIFLLIAIFGLFIGGVKPPTGDITQTSIGGNGTVSVPLPTPVVFASAKDIGGQRIPGDLTPFACHRDSDIGGQQIPRDPSPLGFTSRSEIGGDNQNKPKELNPLGVHLEIGGQQSPPHSLSDIGGQGVETRNVSTKTIGVIVSLASTGDVVNKDIGGGSTPQENRGVHSIENIAIGGNQGAPQVPSLPLVFPQLLEIGGNGTPKPTLPLIGFESQERQEIGGNQGVPQPPLPLVMNDSKLTASTRLTFQPNCKRNYYVFDFNQDFAFLDLEEIGGSQTVPREKDIGGTQSAPRP
jgi:hypothetical protein